MVSMTSGYDAKSMTGFAKHVLNMIDEAVIEEPSTDEDAAVSPEVVQFSE